MTEGAAPLELVGLDAGAEAVYRGLLAHGGGTADDVTAAFGLGTGAAVALLERLHHSGLLSRRSSGEYLTLDPRHALRALVESRERQLAAIRDATGPLGALFDEARRSSAGEPATRTISGPEEVGDCYYRLNQTATYEICGLARPPSTSHRTGRSTRPPYGAAYGCGSSTRPPASTRTAGDRSWAASCRAARRPGSCPRCRSS